MTHGEQEINSNLTAENPLVQFQLLEFTKTVDTAQALDLVGYLGNILDNTSVLIHGLGYADLANAIKLYGFTLMHLAASQTHLAGGPYPNDTSRQVDLEDLIRRVATDLDAGGAAAAGWHQ